MTLRSLLAVFALICASPAIAQNDAAEGSMSFERQLQVARDIVNRKLSELNEELGDALGVDSPLAFGQIDVLLPGNTEYPNPFPFEFQPEQSAPQAFFRQGGGITDRPQSAVLPRRSLCRASQPPSFYAQWALGYLWQCDRPAWFQWDFYGFAGYSHSILFIK